MIAPSLFQHRSRVMATAAAVAIAVAVAPGAASAQNFLEMLFNGGQPQRQQRQERQERPQRPSEPSISDFFSDPFGLNAKPAPAPPPARSVASSGGSGPAFCVRSCDGKYFPLMARNGYTPAQMCQAFCPASPTKIFFGSSINGASSSSGEHYADSENAFAYRKALKPDCTCNGRSSAGLAPVDLSLDTSLKAGDVVATSNGLVAYSGVRSGVNQTAEFTPVASFPGLTTETRARLGEMKVAPVSAEPLSNPPPAEAAHDSGALPAPIAPKPAAPKGKRAALN